MTTYDGVVVWWLFVVLVRWNECRCVCSTLWMGKGGGAKS